MYGRVNHFHALVGLEKGFVGNADLRSLHKLTSTNPKGQLATCVILGGRVNENQRRISEIRLFLASFRT